MANTQPQLFSIPSELRVSIYESVFAEPVQLEKNDIRSRNAGLLLTCKDAHREASRYYYELSTFDALKDDICVDFLKTLSQEKRNQITNIRVHTLCPKCEEAEQEWFTLDSGPPKYRYQHLKSQRDCAGKDLSLLERRVNVHENLNVRHGAIKIRVYMWDENEKDSVEVWTSDPVKVPLRSKDAG